MLKKVTLYGELGERFGKDWELDVQTPAEAIRAIKVNKPDLYDYLSVENRHYHVIIGDSEYIDENSLTYPIGDKEVKIIPAVQGAKKGFMKVILGVLLVTAAVLTVGASLGAATFAEALSVGSTALMGGGTATLASGVQVSVGAGLAGALPTALAKLGVGIALLGVSEMLAPKPKKEVDTNPNQGINYSYNGPINTVQQGLPLPLCYGRLVVGGAVISAGIQSKDLNYMFVREET